MDKNGRIPDTMFCKKSQQNLVMDYTTETDNKDGVKDANQV